MLNNKKILITGGTGSWGQELTRQIIERFYPKKIIIYSRGELKQVDMRRNFQNNPLLKFVIGDIRDKRRLMSVMKDIDFVFHLAALKHVPICEENPWEAVQTNIIGTQNIIDACIENNVEKVVDVSTDKAVDPLNLYGVSKACGEKLIIAANQYSKHTRFVCIRGGNVLGTNGSVVPLFKEQILKLNAVTITDKRMTRFLMKLEHAIELVLKATIEAVGGEVYVMKMPACKIIDLAEVMIDQLGDRKTNIETIGIRPGEKLYEVLVSRYECPRTIDSEKYFIILPQIDIPFTKRYYKNRIKGLNNTNEYNSKNTKILPKKAIFDILVQDGWFGSRKKSSNNSLQKLDKSVLKNYFSLEGWTKED